MMRQFAAAAVLLVAIAGFAAQQDTFTKSFKQYREVAPGIDFFAVSPGDVTPFEKPVQAAQARLFGFLGKQLARGAVVIYPAPEQKDSISERRLLKMGYKWALIIPSATNRQVPSQPKAQTGGQARPALTQSVRNPSPDAKSAGISQLVTSSVQKIGNAILMTTLAPDLTYRSSRVDDVGRSPLADWLDVGLVSYAAGSSRANLGFLQRHLEEAFPLEDVLSMSRPFLAPAGEAVWDGGGAASQAGVLPNGGPGGGDSQIRVSSAAGSVGRGAPDQRQGGSGAMSVGTGHRAGQSADGEDPSDQGMTTMPKDVQDRLFFDAESASFFAYLIGKLGMDKGRTLIQASLDKKDLLEILIGKDMLGEDLETVETVWHTWVKNQKPDFPAGTQLPTAPDRPNPKP